ncbi:histidine phosphatase family protein [Nakamurella lactea]|uniref:histidine phosphatase family protein n=1 Tax=Nakamurella lactea TaxID=459515 RepID=UPI0003F77616|nr:histidine phosphatase family protein [Nakamurella lactea]
MSGTVTIHLVRHAESRWNVEGRYQGQTDSGLTDDGVRQAAALGEALADLVPAPDLVISSDLPRAMDTCRPYAARIGARVVTDRALREISVGDWSGRTFGEIAAEHPDTVAAVEDGVDLPRGGGETFAQTRSRVAAALARAVGRLPDGDGDRAMVAVSHGGPIRVAAAAALGLPSPGHTAFSAPDNCSVTSIRIKPGGARELLRYNHTVAPAGTADAAELR